LGIGARIEYKGDDAESFFFSDLSGSLISSTSFFQAQVGFHFLVSRIHASIDWSLFFFFLFFFPLDHFVLGKASITRIKWKKGIDALDSRFPHRISWKKSNAPFPVADAFSQEQSSAGRNQPRTSEFRF